MPSFPYSSMNFRLDQEDENSFWDGSQPFSQVVCHLNKSFFFLHLHLPHEFGFLWQQASKPLFLFGKSFGASDEIVWTSVSARELEIRSHLPMAGWPQGQDCRDFPDFSALLLKASATWNDWLVREKGSEKNMDSKTKWVDPACTLGTLYPYHLGLCVTGVWLGLFGPLHFWGPVRITWLAEDNTLRCLWALI